MYEDQGGEQFGTHEGVMPPPSWLAAEWRQDC